MEIKNSLLKNLDPYRARLDSAAEANAAKAGNKAGEASAVQPPAGDRVSLSSSARLHTAAHTAATQAPDVRQDKINALKGQVASGEYTVDARKTAQKLLESESLLAETVRR